MNRRAVLFLVFAVPLLSAVLAVLGWMTLPGNLMGWFLLLTGAVYFFGTLYIFWVKGVRAWKHTPGGETAQEERSDRSFWFILPGMVACFFLSPLEYRIAPPIIPRALALQIAGLALVIAGAALFGWARRALSASYSGHLSVTQAQPLVQHGPYRFVRHPAYLGFILIGLGVSLGYSSLVGLSAVPLLVIPGFVYRIRVEDCLLAAHFGEAFHRYAASTARLLPGIW